MLASVTSWLSGMVAPGARSGPRLARVELDLLLPDDVVPAHPHVGRLSAGVTVLLMLMEMTACPCCTPMLDHLPDRHAGDVDGVAAGQAGDVGQLRVDRVPAAEERDVADPARPGPTSSTRQTRAKIANLNAEAGKWRQNLTTTPRAAG